MLLLPPPPPLHPEAALTCLLHPQQHVQDGRKERLEGFVKTFEKELSGDAHPGIYALDCEMVRLFSAQRRVQDWGGPGLVLPPHMAPSGPGSPASAQGFSRSTGACGSCPGPTLHTSQQSQAHRAPGPGSASEWEAGGLWERGLLRSHPTRPLLEVPQSLWPLPLPGGALETQRGRGGEGGRPVPGTHLRCIPCPQSYTTYGLELTRVTVVDTDVHVVYDTFVKPDNEIVDYNTRCGQCPPGAGSPPSCLSPGTHPPPPHQPVLPG